LPPSPIYTLFPYTTLFRSFKQNNAVFNNQIDILWVVDNSGSMNPYQTNLTNNFSSFINNFQNKGYDFHISVTTSDTFKADPTLSDRKSTRLNSSHSQISYA